MERLSDFILRVYPLEGLPFKRRLLLHCVFWSCMFVFYWIGIGFPDSSFIYKLLTATNLLIVNSVFFYLTVYGVFALNYTKTYNYFFAGLFIVGFYIFSSLISYYRIVLIVENNWLSAIRNRMADSIFEYYKGGIFSFFKFSDLLPNIIEIILTSLPAFFVKFSRVFAKNLSEKKQIEIDYLKSQISPHFLVNTLNNIYSLTITEDERSGDAILSLSSMLNYVLYETSEPLISLDMEVKFLQDFISLEQIRNTKKLKVTFEVEGNMVGKVAPLILIAFVENAFKHSIGDSTMVSIIKIHLRVADGYIHFQVENTKPTQQSDRRKMTFGGIGLSNVKKRLVSLYSNKHTLEVKNERNLYTINLALVLK
jgi:two-component system LytT family sensor kinase